MSSGGDEEPTHQRSVPHDALGVALEFTVLPLRTMLILGEEDDTLFQDAVVSSYNLWEGGAELLLGSHKWVLDFGVHPLLQASLRFDPERPVNLASESTDRIAEHLPELPHGITTLIVDDCDTMTGAGLKTLPQLTSLRHFEFNRSDMAEINEDDELVDSDVISMLDGLTALETLTLRHHKELTADIGEAFVPFSSTLTALDLNSCSAITSDIGPHLATLEKLEVLRMDSCYELDSSVGYYLTGLPHLRELELNYMFSMDSGIGGYLMKMGSRLEVLGISSIEDNAVAEMMTAAANPLGELTGLKKFDLFAAGDQVTNDIVPRVLSQMPKLRELNIGRCSGLTDGIGAHLATLTGLRDLSMSDCRSLTAKAFAPLGQLPHLERLCLYESLELQDEVGEYLGSCKTLKVLDIANCLALTTDVLRKMGTMKSLTKLNAMNCKLTDECGALLVNNFENMEDLNLAACVEVRDVTIRELTRLKKLQKLNVSGTGVTNASALDFLKMPSLMQLLVLSCEGIRPDEFLKDADVPFHLRAQL